MAVKSVSIRIEEEMLQKLGFVADYEGRSVNSQILVLVRESIRAFEEAHGPIDGTINTRSSVRPQKRGLNAVIIRPKSHSPQGEEPVIERKQVPNMPICLLR